MILKSELVQKAVSKQRPIGRLFKSVAGELLDDYKVSDYITSERIPEAKLVGMSVKRSAEFYFENHRLIMSLRIDDLLKYYDANFVKEYHAQKRFPHNFFVHFFDTFVVTEILPYSLHTEFLIIAPIVSDDNDIIGGTMAGIAVVSLCHGITEVPNSQISLYVTVDQLLEYLRTGLGRRKFFGIF